MLLDTAGLLSYLDAADPRHADAVAHMGRARQRLTHNYVLAELVALGQARRVNRRLILGFVAELAEDPDIDVRWITEADHRAAVGLLQARPDKDYSLCDAVSFVLMRQAAVTEALTTDHHFEQEGFVRLLPR